MELDRLKKGAIVGSNQNGTVLIIDRVIQHGVSSISSKQEYVLLEEHHDRWFYGAMYYLLHNAEAHLFHYSAKRWEEQNSVS